MGDVDADMSYQICIRLLRGIMIYLWGLIIIVVGLLILD